ncbi:MAG: MFS transporter [Spirochaetes bacterium]|nr:MFS transporter [Spirochaetota bacterium]
MNKSVNFRPLLLGTLGAFFAFFLFGNIDNLKGPTMAMIIDDLQLTYTDSGIIFFAIYLGFTFANLIGGFLCTHFGNKKVILSGVLFILTGILTYSQVSQLILLFLGMLIIGTGFGLIEVSGNSLIVELYQSRKKEGKYILLLNFSHSLGAMIAPYLTGLWLTNQVHWRQIYQVMAIPLIFLLLVFLFYSEKKLQKKEHHHLDFKETLKIAISSRMVLFYIMITGYVGLEIGIASWLVEYLNSIKSLSLILSSTYLSIFFGAIMLGRLAGSFVIDHFNHFKMLLIATIGLILFIIIGTLGENQLAIFLPLTGVFMSIIFPTICTAVSALSAKHVQIRLGFLLTFAGVGGMIGPYLLGIAGDFLGLRYSFIIVLLLLCMALLIPLVIILGVPVKVRENQKDLQKN